MDKIELFDEYEQWHLMCTHYTLVLAAKGIMLELMDKLIDESSDFDLKFSFIKNENIIGISEFSLKFGVRFGHSVCYDGLLDKIYVIGGFGESINEVGRHKRLNTIEIIDLKNMCVEISTNVHADRLFGTSCYSDNKIFLIFGRSSPNKSYEMVSLVNFQAEIVQVTNETPLSRWRHGSCKLNDERIVIFGGKRFNSELNLIETLSDCHVFSNNSWKKIDV